MLKNEKIKINELNTLTMLTGNYDPKYVNIK